MNISRAVSRLSSFARPAGSSATRIVARQPTSGVVARAYAGGKSEVGHENFWLVNGAQLTHSAAFFVVQHAGHEGEYGDLVIPHVESWHKHAAYAIGTTFWLWIFWRFKHDWKATLVGFCVCVCIRMYVCTCVFQVFVYRR